MHNKYHHIELINYRVPELQLQNILSPKAGIMLGHHLSGLPDIISALGMNCILFGLSIPTVLALQGLPL